jgi:hypothetical protein
MKVPKVTDYIDECLKTGITKPTDMQTLYNVKYRKTKTLACFCMALNRKDMNKTKRDGIDKQQRETEREAQSKKDQTDILDYPEVQSYKMAAETGRVQRIQIERQMTNLHRLWELMNRTDPHTWTYLDILTGIEKEFKKVVDTRGRTVYEKPTIVSKLLSSYNSMFPGHLPKGWGTTLCKHDAGELKDYFTFEEYDLFIAGLGFTLDMSTLGYQACFKAQVNMGSREGKGLDQGNGILGLRWENIDYEARRAKLNEKGGRGKAGRIWQHVPLDLFKWLHGWDDLIRYHNERYGYEPTNNQHAEGRCFPVTYDVYRHMFHIARKQANGRISGSSDTMRPHIMRKTHAQWCKKLKIPLECVCGIFPDGWFGVGWDNPEIVLKYYMSIDETDIQDAQQLANDRIKALGLER